VLVNDSIPLARYARLLSARGLGVGVAVLPHADMATSVMGPYTSPTASCLEHDVCTFSEYCSPSTTIANKVFAPTWPPLGPLRVKVSPTLNEPEIDPADDDTETELLADELVQPHVSLPSW